MGVQHAEQDLADQSRGQRLYVSISRSRLGLSNEHSEKLTRFAKNGEVGRKLSAFGPHRPSKQDTMTSWANRNEKLCFLGLRFTSSNGGILDSREGSDPDRGDVISPQTYQTRERYHLLHTGSLVNLAAIKPTPAGCK